MGKDHEPDNISQTNILFNVLTKNTEVMTELSKTLKIVHDELKKIDETTQEMCRTQKKMETRDKLAMKMIIYIMIGIFLIMLAFTAGGGPDWVREVLIRLLPGL